MKTDAKTTEKPAKKKCKPRSEAGQVLLQTNPKGRPTKFTEEVKSKILSAIRAGNYMEVAAAWAGVNKETFFEWMKKGGREEVGEFRDFSNSIKEALAHAEIADLKIIGDCAKNGSWQASAWRLERKFPDRWGKRPEQLVNINTTSENTKITLATLYKELNDDTETI